MRAGAAAMDVTVARAGRDAGIAGLEFLSGIPRHDRRRAAHERRRVWARDGRCCGFRRGPRPGRAQPRSRPGGARLRLPAAARCPRAGSSPEPCSGANRARHRRFAARMAEVADARSQDQPVRERTGGSTFKNPPEANAWALIDRAGCRGLTRGRRAGIAAALQFPDQHRRRHRRRSRRSGRGGSRPGRSGHRHPARMGRSAASEPPGSRAMARSVIVLMGGWSGEREVSLGQRPQRGCGARRGRVRGAQPGCRAGSRGSRGRARSAPRRRVQTRCTAASARTGACRGSSTCWRSPIPIRACLPPRSPWTSRWRSACSAAPESAAPSMSWSAGRSRWAATCCPGPTWSSRSGKARASASSSSSTGSDVQVAEERWPSDETVMVERYVPGREITVAVMGGARPRRHRDPAGRRLLRLPRQIYRRGERASRAGAAPARRIRRRDAVLGGCPTRRSAAAV